MSNQDRKTPYRGIAILGSTGSIGRNSLEVIRHHPEMFRVLYLTAHQNVQILADQAKEFRPKGVVISSDQQIPQAEELFRKVCPVFPGREGIQRIVEDPEVDIVINAIVGSAGLLPTYQAVSAGKILALANKESLVAAGQLIMEEARRQRAEIRPIDSEHSAIWQCLLGENPAHLRRIILTASGGPFKDTPLNQLKNVTAEEALRHANWRMGAKVSIDSATLMNKGLELIEAHWLFHCPVERIEIIIHPQSIIHSMVEFEDGSLKAQLGVPDMRIPIQFALTYPDRFPLAVRRLSFSEVESFTFERPDLEKFPCLSLAHEAIRQGGSSPAVLNAANEIAVERFIKGEIGFLQIPKVIEKTLVKHRWQAHFTLENLLEIDRWAKEFARNV
ncbi:MAG: 1-deoxy-D-xylulose-5-phosphate reductoisomerase [Calditrichia bacterium]